MKTELLKGVFDMHIHSFPDVAPRKDDDIGLAKAAAAAGMGGIMLKAHQGSTVERAHLVGMIVDSVHVFGGVVLNRPQGGLNPHAVDVYVRLGAKEIWMPTLSADHMIRYQNTQVTPEDRKAFNMAHGASDAFPPGLAKPGDPWPWSKHGRGISLFGEDGKLRPEVMVILEIMAPSDTILGTGHLSLQETHALVDAAIEMGVERIVLTHPEYMDQIPVEDQIEFAGKGVFMERCLLATNPATRSIGGNLPFDVLADNIRKVGVESTVLGTDFGQQKNIHPVEGMTNYLTALDEAGFTQSEIERMAIKNPSGLLGLT
jgi:hypothetical protein